MDQIADQDSETDILEDEDSEMLRKVIEKQMEEAKKNDLHVPTCGLVMRCKRV